MPVQFSQDTLPVNNAGERHISVVLLVDTSGSMSGTPINELNKGLREFGNALQEDPLALGRVDVCIISFSSSVETEMSFRPAVDYEAPVLSAHGITKFNEAIQIGLDAIENRKNVYKKEGVSYYRPWLFVLTDGQPTDSYLEPIAKSRLQKAIRDKKVTYMPMGIGDAVNVRKLQEYYPNEEPVKPVLKAEANTFKEAFIWLSTSISVITSSDPDSINKVKLPPTPSCITVGI